MKTVILNFHVLKSASEVHAFLKEELGFPEYYGNNLDALHDVLTELSEETTIFVVSGGQEFEEGFMAVLRDSEEESGNLHVRDGAVILAERQMNIRSRAFRSGLRSRNRTGAVRRARRNHKD